MSSRPPISDELKKLLCSTLLSKALGVELTRIVVDYAKFVGKPLPYKQCGFDNVMSFLQAVPDVAQIIELPNSVVTVKVVNGDHCLAHVNPTAHKALYQPNKDKPLTANSSSVCITRHD